ncbi:MAG: TGS domain-containing protein [Acidimicrobiia bacterium]|nr:TGS domain-containing protein [Acidimicrobiia bacterium]
MPTNATPEYKEAEAAYRAASDPKERLACLREMHRTIPKHKGTEHVRADIKTRIKELTEQLASGRSGGARTGPATVVRPEGAAQIALVGPPNGGKSALHARLTGSHTEVGPYPFATQWPAPGMLEVDDVALQLVDLPSVSPDHPIPWIGDALRPADGALVVVDLTRPGCVEEVAAMLEVLADRHVVLHGTWPADDGFVPSDDPFTTAIPALLAAGKADLLEDPAAELAIVEELLDLDWPTTILSVESGVGLDDLGPWLFRRVGVVRVYTKTPGSDPDMGRPFTVRSGDTVLDVARLVHKDLAEGFRHARIWGPATFDGQQVGRDHPVVDGDVVEIHA